MPIVDIELVAISERALSQILVNSLADSLGKVFGSQPGRTWVRLRFLSREAYAENETNLSIDQLPVFVTVLHAHPSKGAALMTEVNAITFALASCLDRDSERVHVQYAPAAAGRQAFGGKLAR